jgi:hypothetical protein
MGGLLRLNDTIYKAVPHGSGVAIRAAAASSSAVE